MYRYPGDRDFDLEQGESILERRQVLLSVDADGEEDLSLMDTIHSLGTEVERL